MPRSLDLIARLIADTKQFKAGMKDAEVSVKQGAQRLRSAGRAAEKAGKEMSRNITLPLLAVGAAAAKLSIDFESTFAKMQGLAGVAASEVEGLKKSVLGLAGETGKAPQELAEALYFIRSAGVDGAAALETLEVSAKAAAAGLGSTVDIANAVTNALNAYGEANISAAEATDVLVETARQGKAEAADLAPQFGKLLPVASELGITFDQVGAGLAFLSRTSGSAELSATLLSNVMSKLLKPSKQAIEVLGGVGLTLEDVQKSIREDGLLSTLQSLREQLPRDAFVKFFEDAQAVQGALAFTGATAKEAQEVFKALEESTGATDTAFAAFAETAGFKNAQAFAKLQAALIELGDAIVPVVTTLAQFGGMVAEVFSALPGPVQKGAAAFGGLLAATGPLLSIGGKLAQNWRSIKNGLETVALKSMYAKDKLVALRGTLVAGLGFAGAAAGAGMLAESLTKQTLSAEEALRATENFTKALDEQDQKALVALDNWGRFDDLVRDVAATNQVAAARLLDQAEAAGVAGDTIATLRGELEQTSAVEKQSKIDAEAHAAAIDGTAEAFDNATDAAKAYTDSLRAQFDPYFGLLDALQKNRDAQAALNELQKSGKATGDELAAAQRDLASSALDVEGAASILNAAIEDQPGLLGMGKEALQRWVESGLVSEAQAKKIAYQMEVAASRARDLGNVDPTVNVQVERGHLDRLLGDLSSITAKRYLTHIEARLIDGQRALGGPVLAAKTYLVGENGPELFIPNTSGNIIPNGGAGTAVASTMSVVIHMPPGSDGEDVVKAIKRYEGINGTTWRD